VEINERRKQYIRHLVVTKDLSPLTIRAYDSDISIFERYIGQRGAPVIDKAFVLAFLDGQRDAGLSAASLRRRASAVRGYCRWLLASGVLAADPWAGTVLGAGRARKLPRLLPTPELRRLLLFLRQRAGTVKSSPREALERPHEMTTLLTTALMLVTGVRVGEVASIMCGDIDLEGNSVRILGKGRRERQVFLGSGWITGLTRAYLRRRESLGVAHAHLLFNRRLQPLTAAAIRARLHQAAGQAGIRIRVTPHMLRHTAATQLIEAGVDIRYIQRLLGHASLTTTEIYTHISDQALKQVVTDADILGRCCSSDN
jgi:site-specific recombinase XerD